MYTIIDFGQTYSRPTGAVHTFVLPSFRMTISFILSSAGQVTSEYPKYVLESGDGSYKKELSPSSDLVEAGHYLQLHFDKLLPGRNYTLTRFLGRDQFDVIFRDVPFDVIVDQDRPKHAVLENHAYVLTQPELGPTTNLKGWNVASD